MIKEDYVSFETAKLLKEKGFPFPSTNFEDWVCCMYDENGNIKWGCYYPDWYVRVTHQMAMKWLREEKNFFIEIQCYGCETNEKAHFEYSYVIEEFVKYEDECITLALKYIKGKSRFNSYEEACDAAIKYCLEKLI